MGNECIEAHEKKWPGPGSNRRHQDFQSCALPTELPGQHPLELTVLGDQGLTLGGRGVWPKIRFQSSVPDKSAHFRSKVPPEELRI